jgi:hypothetical protein
VLALVSVSSPEPDFVSPVAEPLSTIVEEIVRPAAVLLWITTKSPPAEPASVPPVIVERFAPTPAVTRMPPVTVFEPVRVSVRAPVPANRRLLAAIAPSSVGELVTSMLALE